MENRPRLRSGDERDAGTRACAPADELLDEVWHIRLLRARHTRERRRVLNDVRRDGNALHDVLELLHRLAVEDLLELDLAVGSDVADNRLLVRGGRILDDDVEEEAVHLSFRQRVRTFLLDRVLRSHDEERLWQVVRLGADGDVVLLHRLEKRGLRLRRRTVDFVGEEHVREDRTFDEAELPAAGLLVFLEDVGSRDVGRHQVRRELDALELEVEDLRERGDEERLGEARNAHQKDMAAGEDGGQHEFDDVHLSDNDLGEVLLCEIELVVQELDQLDIVGAHLGRGRVVDLDRGLLGRRRRSCGLRRRDNLLLRLLDLDLRADAHAELDAVAGLEPDGRYLVPVNVSAVRRPEVLKHPCAVLAAHERVERRDVRVLERELALAGIASDLDSLFGERIRLGLVVAGYRELGFHCRFPSRLNQRPATFGSFAKLRSKSSSVGS